MKLIAWLYALQAAVAEFLAPMTHLVNMYNPFGVQKVVTSRLPGMFEIGMLQYCLSPSAINLYLPLAAI